MRAISYLEVTLKGKNKQRAKSAIPFGSLGREPSPPNDLSHALEEFLPMEHLVPPA